MDEKQAIREELLPICKEALKHKRHWQQQTHEAVAAVRQNADAVKHNRSVPRAPLPYMPDNPRLPDANDNPWRYLILGQALEEIFGFRSLLIPGDVAEEAANLYQYLRVPLYDYVHRASDLCDIQLQWEILKDDLPKTAVPGVPPFARMEEGSTPQNVSKGNNAPQANANPSDQKKKRLSDKEKKALITAELVKNPNVMATEIAEATGIHRTTVSRLWQPVNTSSKAGGLECEPLKAGCLGAACGGVQSNICIWSKRRSSASCRRMYSRIAVSSRPTVEAKYPRAQKCCPVKFLRRPPTVRAM